MQLKSYKPTTPGRRHLALVEVKFKGKPEKSLIARVSHHSAGRNYAGRVTIRHRGGGEKRFLRIIDWKRNIEGIPGKVDRLEYDPNRSSWIALIVYGNGAKRYILAPDGLVEGQIIMAGNKAPIEVGNCLPLSEIPIGMAIHNLEIRPGRGAQMVRSAGQAAIIQAKDEKGIDVKLPSGELRRFVIDAKATIGQVSNVMHKNEKLGKAGRRRHMGWRPAVRGVAMNPRRHPHGGGEGRSGIGLKSPKSLWGKRTMGKKTRKNKYSNRLILKDGRIKE
ncbi:50S ribosomal protein L2 [Candidatus Collierbacteria bacterium]|nr:50S ribosomal protein L2 [Candidatus Collierbacteria bacterium]